MTKYFAALLMFFVAWPSFAADPNGYTAQYECRAGGPRCNVDVAALANQACQQTITTSTQPTNDWSALNQSNTVICIQAGDHTGRGTLTLTASGTSGTRKVLRYIRASDNNNEPWNQSAGDKATIKRLSLSASADYWIIHRLTVDNDGGNFVAEIYGHNNILNRVLLEDGDSRVIFIRPDATGNTVQNSILRSTSIAGTGSDDECVGQLQGALNTHFVNNEIYDCHGDGITAQNGLNTQSGLVIENNDIYLRNTFYSDGSGNLTTSGGYACAENAIDIKNGGTSANPVRIIHNRMWGFRPTDSNCAGGSSGDVILVHAPDTPMLADADYVLIQNNVIFDGPIGISSPNALTNRAQHVSIIGNLIYDMTHRIGKTAVALNYGKGEAWETYLNTVINADAAYQYGGTNNDTRCNVFVNAGAPIGSPGAGEIIDDNAFYNSTKFTIGGTDLNNINYVGVLSSKPSYCFYRKLRSGPEQFCIPNALGNPICPNKLGIRTGIGINNDTLQ